MCNAKEYLSQINRYNAIIQNKMIEIEQLRDLASGIKGICYDKDRVQTTPTDRMAEIVSEIVEVEEELKQAVTVYLAKKKNIINTIEQVENDDAYNLLHKKYVENKKLYEVAADMDISYESARQLHKTALYRVETIIKSR